MRPLLALVLRELKSLFYSPIAYVVLCLVLALNGLNFYLIVAAFSAGPTPVTVVEAFFNTGAFWFSFFAIFPLITMRLYAEEFRSGTDELLQTAPVRDWQIIVAKFGGAYLFFLLLWLPTALYFGLYRLIAREQAAPALGNYYGTFLLLALMGAFFISVGCLASVLTRNQIIAAITSFVILAVIFNFSILSFVVPNLTPAVRGVLSYISSVEHMYEFNRGIISTRPVVYYLSGALLLQFLTLAIWQVRRGRL
jgi:ABC-2 type transport system permease protein